jgi:5-methylcytosine-specific restriction enzyme A
LAAWKRLRLAHLKANPLCVKCKANGRVEAATVVHHIRAHRGERTLFLDPTNLESSCKPHHDSATGKGR